MDPIEGPWSLEEDEMLLNLFRKHRSRWPRISRFIPGRSALSCSSRWFSLQRLFMHEEDKSNEDLTISDHNIFIQPPSVNGGQKNSYIHNLNFSQLALGGVSDQAASNGDMAMETGSQNSIYQGNSSHEVGGMVSGRPPSISDMARENMSSGGTYSYSRDRSAPSWNALYIRDSSPMMTDSDSVQQFVGSKFGRNDFSEVSSTSIVHGKLW